MGCGCDKCGGGNGGQIQNTSLATGVVNQPVELNASNKQVGQQWIFVRPSAFVPPAARASDK